MINIRIETSDGVTRVFLNGDLRYTRTTGETIVFDLIDLPPVGEKGRTT